MCPSSSEVTGFLKQTSEIIKIDRKLGIAFGFAIVCKEIKDGKVEDYYDLQGDHIPEDVMLKAACDFALSESRTGKAQHDKEERKGKVADVAFVFPLTEEVAKALDIRTERYGLLIGYKPTDAGVLDDIEKGVYTGFSLGGEGVREEVVA